MQNYTKLVTNIARDLEMSLYNYFFLGDDMSDCLLALTLYLNDDGGVGNIDPDNLNNQSSLSSCIYYLDILFKLNYFEENEITLEIIKYLKIQKNYSYYIKSNEEKPCSKKYKENKYYLELEAITKAYIYKYTNSKSNVDNLINEYLLLEKPNLNQIYYFKQIEYIFNNEKLKEKIIKDTLNLEDKEIHKLIFNKNDYLLIACKEKFIKQKEYILKTKNALGLWDRESDFENEQTKEVADIKYLSINLINNLLFLSYVEEL